jgi:hypothetical protein
MPTPKALITVLREWLAKADNDLLNATLTLGAACPTDTVRRDQPKRSTHLPVALVGRAANRAAPNPPASIWAYFALGQFRFRARDFGQAFL